MYVTKVDYFETIEGIEILEALHSMSQSNDYITEDTYTPHSEELKPFIEKHQDFIRKHPSTNAQHYVSNLRIMCRRR